MIEKAIENWLISTNEKNYQIALCQVLLHEGYKIIYISTHRSLEQGKDIIAVDKTGDYYAYQLKTGDINLSKWRAISGEIRDLMELPIKHPSIDTRKIHKSYLVTNGRIIDEVRDIICEKNRDNKEKDRKFSYLDVIDGQILLKKFIDAQGSFIPKELEDFNFFLRLFTVDGSNFLPKEEFSNFLNNMIFRDFPKNKSHVIDAITSSIIITTYILKPFQIKNNYYALFEAWTILVACIIRYAQKNRLRRDEWEDSYQLIISEIVRNLTLLKDEIISKENYLEGELLGDGGQIYWARVTIVFGVLAALENHLQTIKKDYVVDKKLLDAVKENFNFLWLWGESSFPFIFNLIKFLESNNEIQNAELLLNNILLTIVKKNAFRKGSGWPNPYYSVNDILEVTFGMKKIDYTQFSGSSFILESLIQMMTRRNHRKILEENWKAISNILFREFKPDNIEDTFIWHVDEGSNYAESPKATQSWAELKKEANDLSDILSLFEEYINFLNFFILVFPHRSNKLIIKLLDQAH